MVPWPTGRPGTPASTVHRTTRTAEELHWWLSPVGNVTSMDGSTEPCAFQSVQELVGDLVPEFFPNPVAERLTFRPPSGPLSIDRIEVRDLAGRSLLTERVTGRGDAQLDLTDLPPGTYFFTCFAGGKRLQAVKVSVLR